MPVVTVATLVPSRSTSYPATATSSADANQLTAMVEADVAVAETPPGTDGAVVSGGTAVVNEAVALTASFKAASRDRTR